jgi:hypothetical protein
MVSPWCHCHIDYYVIAKYHAPGTVYRQSSVNPQISAALEPDSSRLAADAKPLTF